MSTAHGKSGGGKGIPDVGEADVLRSGSVSVMRNPAGRKFSSRDVTRINAGWNGFAELEDAIETVRSEERRRSVRNPPAWDPEFGYLSPDPSFCGSNLFISCVVHLEGLNLLGDLKYVLAALSAMRISFWSFDSGSFTDTAHIYRLENTYSFGISEEELARRVTDAYRELVRQEINARRHLACSRDGRVLSDAVARSLAVLRSARMLSPWEMADMLSPVRVAAAMGFIDGITTEEIDDFTDAQLEKDPADEDCRDEESGRALDRRDADFADRMNRRFENVRLNAAGIRHLEQ